MKRHVRNDHAPSHPSDGDPDEITIEVPKKGSFKGQFDCPMRNCLKTYKTVGWWKKHVSICHPRVVMLDHEEGAGDNGRAECGEPLALVRDDAQTAFDVVRKEFPDLLDDLPDLLPCQAADLDALWKRMRPGAELEEEG